MDDFAASLENEIAAEAVRQDIHAREAARHRGVAWSALAPEPPSPASFEILTQRARHAAEARRAWRASASARFVNAIVTGQQAAGLAHQACERARAAWSRDFMAEAQRCAEAASELEGLA